MIFLLLQQCFPDRSFLTTVLAFFESYMILICALQTMMKTQRSIINWEGWTNKPQYILNVLSLVVEIGLVQHDIILS